ncbi:MAG: hypothetical protein A3F17_02910 [Gammaproteobacteria bacterium RIFCSPHIGHO2_12_FULL_41_15]|nr:MAG: hypothetical protein A3F17_02910 [Gammaproteobacteria bacterium RIFCSPHIGHO2_12_FULL_41_15]
MTNQESQIVSSVLIINEEQTIGFTELCHASSADPDFILSLIEQELIQPRGHNQSNWQFDALSLKRSRIAVSFHNDLQLNLQGIALALDLLEQIETMRAELTYLRKFVR